MFGYISTKDLYSLKLAIVESQGFSKYHYVGSSRYALAKKKENSIFIQLFLLVQNIQKLVLIEERALLKKELLLPIENIKKRNKLL